MWKENFLKDLETLVNIDSNSKDPEGIAKIADFFQEKFEKLGWQVKRHQIHPEAGPMLEITNNKGVPYDVGFFGHMDTVFPTGTAAMRPYKEMNGRAYGPGVYDMKSGCLLAYYLCKGMQEKGELKQISICIGFNPDEEISSRYSRPYLEEIMRDSRYALIMEGGRPNGNLVHQRKGVGKFTVEFFGKATHAGVAPEEGASSIHELLRRGEEILSWARPEIGTTINLGVIRGGTVSNTVADYAAVEVDVRIRTLEEAGRIEKAFAALPEHGSILGVRIEVSGKIFRPPLDPNTKSLAFCEEIDRIKERIHLDIGWTSTGGGSDGNFSSALGIPTVDALGPIGGDGHQESEYMEIDSLDSRYQLLHEIVQFCSKDKNK